VRSHKKGVTMITRHGEVEHDWASRFDCCNLLIISWLLELVAADVSSATASKSRIREPHHARL
jgi:hypothetical protein